MGVIRQAPPSDWSQNLFNEMLFDFVRFNPTSDYDSDTDRYGGVWIGVSGRHYFAGPYWSNQRAHVHSVEGGSSGTRPASILPH